jgi:hypothetical protein
VRIGENVTKFALTEDTLFDGVQAYDKAKSLHERALAFLREHRSPEISLVPFDGFVVADYSTVFEPDVPSSPASPLESEYGMNDAGSPDRLRRLGFADWPFIYDLS